MLFGQNTNVKVEGITYHVQTEDRGVNHAVIDTTVHCRGRVMHRRTKDYLDLLPMDTSREQELRVRLDEQHRAVIAEMRSGALQLPAPPPEPPPRLGSVAHLPLPAPPLASGNAPTHLKLELLNPKTWLRGKAASLQVIVRDDASHTVAGASVSVRVDGGSGPVEFLASSRENGTAEVEFEMPRLVSNDAVLIIEAKSGTAQGQLRFVLRARPKTSSQ